MNYESPTGGHSPEDRNNQHSDLSEEGNNSENSNVIEQGNPSQEKNVTEQDDTTQEWNSLASFVVEFQSKTGAEQTEQRTIVNQQSTGRVSIWPGIETEQIPKWLQQQLSEIISTEPAPELLQAATLTPLSIEFEQLRLLQPPQTKMPLVSNLNIFPGCLNSNKPFILEVSWKLLGTISPEVTPYPPYYRIQVYARDRTTGRITTISETLPVPLSNDKSFYNNVLPETSLPAGIYRLQLLITLQGKLAPPAFLEVQLLQVV